jgi:hypothetical protein
MFKTAQNTQITNSIEMTAPGAMGLILIPSSSGATHISCHRAE